MVFSGKKDRINRLSVQTKRRNNAEVAGGWVKNTVNCFVSPSIFITSLEKLSKWTLFNFYPPRIQKTYMYKYENIGTTQLSFRANANLKVATIKSWLWRRRKCQKLSESWLENISCGVSTFSIQWINFKMQKKFCGIHKLVFFSHLSAIYWGARMLCIK